MKQLVEQSPGVISALPAAARILVTGRVQGVGFRPLVARLANDLALAGQVTNTNQGVEIVVEGEPPAIGQFLQRLRDEPPALATIAEIDITNTAASGRRDFTIAKSAAASTVRTAVPLDLAACSDCLEEVQSANNRRTAYPFTSCTHCGPRYSILASLPYERSATAMAAFPMCQACSTEYEQPVDRRFHAESIACPECGPRCWLRATDGQIVAEGSQGISIARGALRAGQIVALRGIGGYQLLVDATNAAAVARLRERKQRPAKPLAVLVESLAHARELGSVDHAAEQSLASAAGPIVLVPARKHSLLAASVSAGLSEVGIMLPTSPLHWLIAHGGPPLVATSGNIDGRPLEYQADEAQQMLANVADLLLHHDRPILRAIDDSVVKMIAGNPVTLRAGRGIAPLPLTIRYGTKAEEHSILAVGGQQNNALAIWNGCQAVLGPHIGDLDELATCQRWQDHRCDLCQLLGDSPSLVVHDLHPDYFTTRWAAESGLPTIAVQHHHAHVAAAMLAPGWLDREVLGVAWDGTGYGPDGTIWGGEFLRATTASYQRVARLRPFVLPGGEAAIREPWRLAVALLAEISGADAAIEFFVNRGWECQKLMQLNRLLNRRGLWSQTSSMGRLFDAVATMILPYETSSGGQSLYEGQLAMLLESTCEWSSSDSLAEGDIQPYIMPLVHGTPDELDWRPLIHAVVTDLSGGAAPAIIARRFHAALANAIATVSDKYFELPVVVCGGVFQNRVLTEMTQREFAARPQSLSVPRVIPPGDGGLAAGQLAVALAQFDRHGGLPR